MLFLNYINLTFYVFLRFSAFQISLYLPHKVKINPDRISDGIDWCVGRFGVLNIMDAKGNAWYYDGIDTFHFHNPNNAILFKFVFTGL